MLCIKLTDSKGGMKMAWHLSFLIKSVVQISGTKPVLIPQLNYVEVCVHVCTYVCFNGRTRLSHFDQ